MYTALLTVKNCQVFQLQQKYRTSFLIMFHLCEESHTWLARKINFLHALRQSKTANFDYAHQLCGGKNNVIPFLSWNDQYIWENMHMIMLCCIFSRIDLLELGHIWLPLWQSSHGAMKSIGKANWYQTITSLITIWSSRCVYCLRWIVAVYCIQESFSLCVFSTDISWQWVVVFMNCSVSNKNIGG